MKQPNYELLKDAYAIIGGIPDAAIKLNFIMSQQGESLECGTICCAAGWLGHHPQFQALGLGVDKSTWGGRMALNGETGPSAYKEVMAEVFGIPKYDAMALFDMRNGSEHLLGFSDKEVFLLRVRNYLRKHGQL